MILMIETIIDTIARRPELPFKMLMLFQTIVESPQISAETERKCKTEETFANPKRM